MPPAMWFTQELDHLDHQSNATWQQRYYVNDTFYVPGGPIFFQIGGEAAISPLYVLVLEYVNYAAKYGALIVALEHRFYGASQPLPDLSTQNLAFLSSQQALADAATFIEWFQGSNHAQNAPVITFGGSYPGNLAAWFRLQYPQLTYGTVASSAPVQATLDFFQYLDVVDKSLSYFTGPECDILIQSATTSIQSMIISPAGRAQLVEMFNVCPNSNLTSQNDVTTFISDLMGNWMGTVQYNDENNNPITIDYLCGMMDNASSNPLQAYAAVSNLFLNLTNQPCLDASYSSMITMLQDTTPNTTGVGFRQWTYQTCTQFGYFQTTDSPSSLQPFGDLVPLQYYTQMCFDSYGKKFPTAALINETNTYYGGKDLGNGPTNILFVNGNIDPWHSLSITANLSDTVRAILINGTAHCANMFPAQVNDPPGLAEAQKHISAQIGEWLSSFTYN